MACVDDKEGFPERLKRRDRERQEAQEKRRETRERQVVSEEKADYFTETFNKEKTSLDELLATCGLEQLEDASSRISKLQVFVNDSLSFLPSYDVRQAQAALQRLQASLTDRREQLLPKKKFTFRSRKAALAEAAAVVPECNIVPVAEEAPAVVPESAVEPRCGFSDEDCRQLVKTASEINGQDVQLARLTGCTVKLFGAPSTLHIRQVRDSLVLCGPVSSSVFIDDCSHCVFVFPCQQLRTHNTEECSFYLHVTSRAIIEDCRRMRFAPFTWSYPAIEEHFETAGLDKSKNNWSQVDDFNWLARDEHSPNWSVIPEEERRSEWEA
ncbi:tubulin-specific chaperone C [Polypterus senegalus]